MQTEVRIIFPSSPCQETNLRRAVAELEDAGFHPQFRLPEPDPQLPFLASSIEYRVSELNDALLSTTNAPILCARGGYGASDLLPHLAWEKLKTAKPKWLVGFSDISALQSALFTKLAWPCIHGPMPGTDLWGLNGTQDIELLLNILSKQNALAGEMNVETLSPNHSKSAQGWLFGGCMSVLSNLIGTPYFPASLRGAILFLEDTGETPGRILRMLNQFILSGSLEGVSALILGNFGEDELSDALQKEIAKRLSIPVYVSNDFGHVSPNFPLVLGSKAIVENKRLRWSGV